MRFCQRNHRSIICGITRSFAALAVCASATPAFALDVSGAPTPVFVEPDPFTGEIFLQSLSFNLTAGTALPISIEYQTVNGVSLGAPVAATLPASGLLTIPPPPFSGGADSLGNRVVVRSPGKGPAVVAWYNGNWSWQTPQVTLQCTPSCFGTNVHWTIQGNPALVAHDSVRGTRTVTVVSSGFDLNWAVDIDTQSATVTGNQSRMILSDGTTIAFADGQTFGSTTPLPLRQTIVAIGLSGAPPTTSFTSSSEFAFSPPTVTPVPVPPAPAFGAGTLAALVGALLAVGYAMALGRGQGGLARQPS